MIERVIAGERHVRYPDYPDPIDWTWQDDAADTLLRSLERPLGSFAAINALGDKRLVRDAFAHLSHRFPDLCAEAIAAETPPSGWGLVNDGIDALLGPIRCTRLEEGLDRMMDAAAARMNIMES